MHDPGLHGDGRVDSTGCTPHRVLPFSPSRLRLGHTGAMRSTWITAALAAALAVSPACGDDDTTGATTTREGSATSTTVSERTTDVPVDVGSSTTVGTTSSTVVHPEPGSACELGSDPDCIDPDGDGDGTYLIGGAECMAALVDAPSLCADLDGDGRAGYPDSG